MAYVSMEAETCPFCGASVKKENLKGHYERVHPKHSASQVRPKGIVKTTPFFKKHGRRNILVLSLLLLATIGVSVVVAQIIDASTMKMHIHPEISASINGSPFTIPRDIGTPSGPWVDHSLDQYGMTGMSPLHTHDDTGAIHVESNKVRDFTLREFLAVWGKSVDNSQVLGHPVDPDHRAYIMVDGVEKPATADVALAHGQKIRIVCGP